MVEAEKSAEALPAYDRSGPVVVGRRQDELAVQALALCSSSEPACETDAAACLAECQARIQGVSGLCALCLLDGAHGGPCSSGSTCCPDPVFPTEVATCAALCNG
jgi:hypothetical protein